ncbi:MAG TPA: hypothetical protein VN688_20490 [Gemmataceae bacterium]|nr:hypothetical protein [Gemmataceae bacterium]
MAAGTWEDFTDKYGFNDGAQVEERDFDARKRLVALLNDRPEMQAAKVRALEFDRDGFHNSCLIVLLPAVDGKTDAELMADWMAGPGEEAKLPELTDHDDDTIDPLGEMIQTAYDEADTPEARPFTARELATVLAALRYWQANVTNGPTLNASYIVEGCEHFECVEPLEDLDIDALCESINLRTPACVGCGRGEDACDADPSTDRCAKPRKDSTR